MSDLHLYDRVAEELRHQSPQLGLWAKAFAESHGDKAHAEALYLRLRVAQLAEIERTASEVERKVRAELARAIAERAEMERQARAKAEGLTPIHWVLITLMTTIVISFLLHGFGVL